MWCATCRLDVPAARRCPAPPGVPRSFTRAAARCRLHPVDVGLWKRHARGARRHGPARGRKVRARQPGGVARPAAGASGTPVTRSPSNTTERASRPKFITRRGLVVGSAKRRVAQRPCAESPLHVCVRSGARRVRAHDLVVTAARKSRKNRRGPPALLAADEDEFPAEFGALQTGAVLGHYVARRVRAVVEVEGRVLVDVRQSREGAKRPVGASSGS